MVKAHKAYFQVLLLWILLTTLLASVSLLLGRALLINNEESDLSSWLFLILLILGSLIGLAQWIAINSILKITWYWIPATAIGYSVGSFAIFLISAIAVGLLSHLNQHYYKVYEYLLPFQNNADKFVASGKLWAKRQSRRERWRTRFTLLI